MKIKKWIWLPVVAMVVLSCTKIKTPEAVAERENWYASFGDSIKFYENLSNQIENNIKNQETKISDILKDFEMVKKPREVSGYYIMKGWSSRLPFRTTAIYARINENENLELIATLGGNTFNRINVGDAYSEVVKHDQALNYRHETFNTVYFTGGKADTIARYICNHRTDALKLNFLEGDKRKSQFNIPENEKDMISKTWELYSAQLEIKKLQKEFTLCAGKIATFRRLKDDHQMQKDTTSKK